MNRFLGVTVFSLLMSMALGADASSLSGPIALPGPSCCVAPRDTSTTYDPNNTPVTLTGWVDVSNLSVGSAVFIGLVDKARLETPASTFMSGAYTYISRASATTLWVGPSDGNLGGEIVQEFDIPTNETLVYFTTVIGAGQISVSWTAGAQSGGPIVDTYGDVKTLNNTGAYAWDEFEYGAYLGVDVYADSTPGSVDFYVNAVPEPSSILLLGMGTAAVAVGRRKRGA